MLGLGESARLNYALSTGQTYSIWEADKNYFNKIVIKKILIKTYMALFLIIYQ
jgi:hypothetical protein